MAGIIAILMMLGTVYALLLGGRGHSFKPRLARTSVRRLSGPNFTTIVAVAGLSTILLKAAELPVVASHPSLVPIIVALVVLLVVGYVIVQDFTKLVVGAIGIVLLVATEGVAATIGLVILVCLLLWLLGAARAWFG